VTEFNDKLYNDIASWGRIICFIVPIVVFWLFGDVIVGVIGYEFAGALGLIAQIALVVTVPDWVAMWAAKRYGK
jgi:hypothetical protein